jgi:hypothetical protein
VAALLVEMFHGGMFWPLRHNFFSIVTWDAAGSAYVMPMRFPSAVHVEAKL